MTHTIDQRGAQTEREIDLAAKALKLKMDKCIMGRISYDLFEAQALLNAIQDQKETEAELLEALRNIVKKSPFVPSATGITVELSFEKIKAAQNAIAAAQVAK